MKYRDRPIKSRDLWKRLTKAKQEGRLPPNYKIKQSYETNLETWRQLQGSEGETI